MPSRVLIEVRKSTIQGLGVFAKRAIRRGTRVIEYTGEIITNKEADARYDDAAMDRHHTFLFMIDKKKSIDGSTTGNDAKYINHSCSPNCESINEDGRIFIDAIQDIAAGEELTYDYRYTFGGDVEYDAELLARYVCHCGAPTCRGTILAPKVERRKSPARKVSKRAGSAQKGSRPLASQKGARTG